MLTLSVASDARAIERELDTLKKKQVPFAASQGINRLARQAVDVDLPAEMDKVFDRPTPWVKRGFAWKKSTPRSLTAEIFARDSAGKGNPAWKSLGPEVFGGTRNMKRFERALQATLGPDFGFTVPGRGATLNQYGNMSAGQVEQILSALGAAEQKAGYSANRTKHSAKRKSAIKYFAVRSHHGNLPGQRGDGAVIAIYRVVSAGKVEPVLVFSPRAPSYSKRFDYVGTAQRSFAEHKQPFLADALAKAIATAK